jgi:hypothetical protein
MAYGDLDILNIDHKIRNNFEKEEQKLPLYREKLNELIITSKNSNIPIHSKMDLEKNIKDLTDTVEKISSNRDLNFYITETAELLENYKSILKTPIKISFTGPQKQEDNDKNSIIDKFIDIAQKYHKIYTKPKDKKFRMICDNCPNKKDFIIEDNAYICTDCGSQQEKIENTTSYKDADRVNISTKYTYDRKVHFRDCINQYQGKQNCTIDLKVYEDIEDIFTRHHLINGDKTLKKSIRYSKITKDHILMFLKELGYSKHYENVILIHYNLTGKKPDDISHLEDRLLNDFEILVETYDKIFKNKVSRVNFISTQYVLYQLLQKYHHPCKKEDFVILKTMDRKSFHDTICRELFSLLGWSFTPIY